MKFAPCFKSTFKQTSHCHVMATSANVAATNRHRSTSHNVKVVIFHVMKGTLKWRHWPGFEESGAGILQRLDGKQLNLHVQAASPSEQVISRAPNKGWTLGPLGMKKLKSTNLDFAAPADTQFLGLRRIRCNERTARGGLECLEASA